MATAVLEFSTGTTPEDIAYLAAHMRAADVAEVRACNCDPLEALKDGAADSVLLWTARADGVTVAILGMTTPSLLGATGVPWFLGTDEVRRHRRAFMRQSRVYIAEMLAIYPRLMNYVHSENRQACAWLRRAGFRLGAAVKAPGGAMFYPFEMLKG